MPKQKTPLLSLEAHGTVGGTLTYQGKGERKISRTKPMLPYFLTLPVQYQRWLYEDYAYLWRQQSAATKSAYRVSGAPHHLTGYQYWIKDMLTRLPDIQGMWHLDDNTGVTTLDSSRHGNHGTIIGASPAIGLIGGCLSFDGINDRVSIGPALFDDLANGSYELFSRCTNPGGIGHMFAHRLTDTHRSIIGFSANLYYVYHRAGAIQAFFFSTDPCDLEWHHTVLNFGDNGCLLYIDGVYQLNSLPGITIGFDDMGVSLHNHIGARGNGTVQPFPGPIDHVILRNRPLDQTEITRHSLRRYPAQ